MLIILQSLRSVLLLLFLIVCCNGYGQINFKKKIYYLNEIRKVEKQFEIDLNTKGVAYAFEFYADDSAVINRRNDQLIYGPKAIKEFYTAKTYVTSKAHWSPDYIDISEDGTMAYTYGKYTWITTDSSGQKKESHGIFHTVWKKQKNGSWKYVWD
jgi:ketosteroid isomerase-like protein